MSYTNGFTVDDLVDRKTDFVNKVVVLNGGLLSYEMGPGLFTWELALKLTGGKYTITTRCKISRINSEHKLLLPHLDAYLGKIVGIKVYADSFKIRTMKFGEREFNVLS